MQHQRSAVQGDGLRLRATRYEPLHHVQASLGGDVVTIGEKGICRFCGSTGRERFRKIAHTFPEALGNKWVFSLDECDDCNSTFSRYESALASSVGAFLTLGGVKAKGNHVRQTGYSDGPAYIRHSREDGQRAISTRLRDQHVTMSGNPRTGNICLTFPIAEEKFRPRHAYKALSKMAFALLPPDERTNYEQLRAWLLDPNDSIDFPVLEVAFSFAMVGNSPGIVSGTLLRRINPDDVVPHILFVFTAGSVCLQIDLRSDHKEDHIPCSELGSLGFDYTTHVRDGTGTEVLKWQYLNPVFFNWASPTNELQPIEAMSFDFNSATRGATLEPIFRKSDLLI